MTFNPTVVIAFLIATIVPLTSLFVMRRLDLYGIGFRTMLACFIWGMQAVGIALLVSGAIVDNEVVSGISYDLRLGPAIEEILKSLFLLYLVRRPTYTYFVDGATYGFTCGIGFAIVENYYYLFNHMDTAIGLAIARVMSVNLMHASASALIGIMLGLSRNQKGGRALLVMMIGYVLGVSIHIGYNRVPQVNSTLLLFSAVSIGIGASLIIYFLVRRGLAEEKAWIEETLAQETTVTSGESEIVNRLSESQKILAPLAKKFGPKKAEQIDRFLILQAQLGIKRKTVEKLTDVQIRQAVEAEMAQIRVEMGSIRRSLGPYIMAYIRTIFSEEGSPLFGRLESLISSRMPHPVDDVVIASTVFDGTPSTTSNSSSRVPLDPAAEDRISATTSNSSSHEPPDPAAETGDP